MSMSRHRPVVRGFRPSPGRRGVVRAGLPPVDRRRPDPGLGLPPDRADGPVVPVRERHRRREGRPVQLPRHRAVPDVRGARARGAASSRPGREAEARRLHLRRPVPRPRAAARPSIGPRRLPGLPRFTGGAVGYAAYDAVRYTEHLPDAPPDDRGLPDLSFAFYDRMVLFDHIRKTILVVAQAHVGPGQRPRGRLRARLRPGRRAGRPPRRPGRRARRLRHRHRRARRRSSPGRTSPASGTRRSSATARSTSRPATSSRSCPASGSRSRRTAEPFDIYRVLRVVNPSPFLFYLPFGDFALIGSSPEILVRVEDGHRDDPPAGRHPTPGPRRGRGPGPRRGAAGRPQGTRRAHHARRPRPQRRRPGRRLRQRPAHRRDEGRARTRT